MSLDFNFSLEELEAAESATANPYLSDAARGLQLVTRLMAQPGSHSTTQQRQQLQHLHELVHRRFVALAARDDYPAEAQSYQELIALEQSLEDLAAFPDLANKTVVGVGGGFSAGKSRFLNTLLGVDLLPESLEPTTAIPSYLTHGTQAEVIALNTFAQQVALDTAALQAITHAFHQHYQKTLGVEVGFAHLIRLLMVQRPELQWRNLAFLDTPGYSKADHEGSGTSDAQIAMRQLREADHVLWLLNAKNGSIRQDDLNFLRELNPHKPVFFVVTQADLVGVSRIDAILQSTRTSIAQAGLTCAGVMAWGAPLGELHGQQMGGDDVRQWLDTLDSARKRTQKRLICARTLDAHLAHNNNLLATNRTLLAALNEVWTLAHDGLADNRRAAIQQQIERLRNDQLRLGGLVQELDALKQEMLTVVTHLVGSLAEDEDMRHGQEMLHTMRADVLQGSMNVGEPLELCVEAVKSEIKKVIVTLGNNCGSTALGFSALRNDLKIDPLLLVKGSRLLAEIRAKDTKNITLAISSPHAVA